MSLQMSAPPSLGAEAALKSTDSKQGRADHKPQASEGQQAQKFANLRPRSKRTGVLRTFLERGDRGLNCFEAVRIAHDYVLRSSISDFRRHFGIEFHRRYETVPGHNGGRVECVRYWLTSAGAAKARELLAGAEVT